MTAKRAVMARQQNPQDSEIIIICQVNREPFNSRSYSYTCVFYVTVLL